MRAGLELTVVMVDVKVNIPGACAAVTRNTDLTYMLNYATSIIDQITYPADCLKQ